MHEGSLRGIVTVGLVVLCAASSFADDPLTMQGTSVFGRAETVRYSIAMSDVIVVGRVISDRITETEGKRFRVREIRVDQTLLGTVEPGDTLTVARYMSKTSVFGVPDVHYSLLELGRFLYPLTRLDRRRQPLPNDWLGVALGNKLWLDDPNPESLDAGRWVEWIRHPADEAYRRFLSDQEAAGRVSFPSSSTVDSEAAQQKLDLVVVLIEEELARREIDKGTKGRSN
jgi:hypothetical protein